MSGRGRDTVALALGSMLNGLLAYVVFAVTTRALGAEPAARVAILWSYWAFAGAALTFPLQHWITRTAVAHGEGAVRQALPRVAVVVLSGSLVLGGVAALLRESLFHSDGLWFPLMVSLVTIGSGVVGLARGTLSARRRFVAVGSSLALENAVRAAAVTALYATGVTDPVAYGFCLVAGHLVVLLWPAALRPGHVATSATTTSPFAFLAGAGAGQFVNQVVLTGAPVLLSLSVGSPAEVTALFAALALFRAPYLVATGVMPQVTNRVTQMVVAGDHRAVRRLQRVVLAATAVLVALAVATGWLLGPPLLSLVYGESVELDGDQAAIVAAGCALAVSNLVLVVIELAKDRSSVVLRAWLAALVVSAGAFTALAALDPVDRAAWWFVVAEATAFAALLADTWRVRRGRPGPA